MNRRTKERVDLRLQCRLGPEKVLSVPAGGASQIIGLTSNLSRSGLLMHWLDAVELPALGSDLTVDIDLPAEASFGRRMMRCRTTVVRIIKSDGVPTIGMKIRNIRFVQPTPASDDSASYKKTSALNTGVNGKFELASMPSASERLN
jgi:PilZ domain